MKRALVFGLLAILAPLRLAADPPLVEHQPSPCTVPGKPIALCATITDDGEVRRARIYFRPAGEKFYSVVEMSFDGIKYCGTLPAPRERKAKTIEYYVQAVDDALDIQRTSTFQLGVEPESLCEFPPVETNRERAAAITVYATDRKQGNKLPETFQSAGVTFVPVPGK
ncbi:MAG TPA: hypothetical protein VGQ78_09115 [Vicinamibacteria bacterium]|nr:hypothetical protein [Vicinamibacteria bacterium]